MIKRLKRVFELDAEIEVLKRRDRIDDLIDERNRIKPWFIKRMKYK